MALIGSLHPEGSAPSCNPGNHRPVRAGGHRSAAAEAVRSCRRVPIRLTTVVTLAHPRLLRARCSQWAAVPQESDTKTEWPRLHSIDRS
jgi:hypothetical protein